MEFGTGDTVALTPFATYPASGDGFKANGIVAVDEDTLVYVNSTTGELVRVEIAGTKATFRTLDLGGATVKNGDGLLPRKRTLYVVRNAAGLIAEVRLDKAASSGRVVGETTDSTFRYPTTAAAAGNRFLVVNSQFDKRTAMQPPVLPFTVSSIKRP